MLLLSSQYGAGNLAKPLSTWIVENPNVAIQKTYNEFIMDKAKFKGNL